MIPEPSRPVRMPPDREAPTSRSRLTPRRRRHSATGLGAFGPVLVLILAACASTGASPLASGSSPSAPTATAPGSSGPSVTGDCPSSPPLLASGGGACPAPTDPDASPTGAAGTSPSAVAVPSGAGVGAFHAELGGPRDGAGTYDGSGPIVCTAGAGGSWTVSGAFETTDGIRAIELRQEDPRRVIGALTSYGSGPEWIIAVPSDPSATAQITVDETKSPVTVLASGRSVNGGGLFTMRIELTCGSVIR